MQARSRGRPVAGGLQAEFLYTVLQAASDARIAGEARVRSERANVSEVSNVKACGECEVCGSVSDALCAPVGLLYIEYTRRVSVDHGPI